MSPEVSNFFDAATALAWRKLRERYPESVDAGVYHIDDISICVSFDPHHEIHVLPSEVVSPPVIELHPPQ